MNGFLLTLHIVFSLVLVGVILLQPGAKGGRMGSAFGGGGANTAFGAQGAAPVLAKITYYLAAGFLTTCLMIEYLIVKQNRSVLDKLPESKPAAAATLPTAAPKVPTPIPTAPSPAAPTGAAPTKK